IDLSLAPNREILADAFRFWENQKLNNWAWCIMSNHIHWVFSLNKHDERNNPVYLQDILQSVKRTTARKINEHYGLIGKSLWQKESYDTTIRDHVHLHRAIEYTLNNPVKAGLVKNQCEWVGSWQRIG
uniref:transposase n=1 Tax=Mangrovibacterium sp. TaxID=1961364 RepID=UPI00356A4103